MKLFAFLSLVFYSLTLSANDWSNGYVVLKDNKVIKGEFFVRTDHDVVLLRNGDAEMVYPAYRIKWISIFDVDANVKRDYVSREEKFGAAVLYELYEVVLEGELALLRKERSSWQALSMDLYDYDYFVQHEDALIPLNKFRRKTYRKLYRSASPEFKTYIRENRLNIYQLGDCIQILDRINEEKLFTVLAQR